MLNWIRNLDMRKVASGLAALTAVEAIIAHGDVSLAGIAPSTADIIRAWCGNFVVINQVLLVGHVTTALPWPKAPTPTPAMPKISPVAVLAFFCLLGALAMVHVSSARAADLKLPGKSPISQFGQPYPTNGCGAYYGFNALASALPIADATPGATAIGGDIGGTLGYTCALANGSSWFLEGQGDLQNLNGTGGNGFHLGGQAHLAIRGGVSGPILTMLPSLPNLNLPAVPSLPILPQGVTASGASQTFIYGAVNFDDISAQFGNAQARDWLISPEIGLENRTRLSNNVVAAVWAGGVLESNPICVGGISCPKLSTGLRTGFQFLY